MMDSLEKQGLFVEGKIEQTTKHKKSSESRIDIDSPSVTLNENVGWELGYWEGKLAAYKEWNKNIAEINN